MKRAAPGLLLSAIVGLGAGLIVARRVIDFPADENQVPNLSRPAVDSHWEDEWAVYVKSKAPAEAVSSVEEFLSAQNEELNVGTSPYRSRLSSLDRLASLSNDDLIHLLERGLLTDSGSIDAAIRRLATDDPRGTLESLLAGRYQISVDADQQARQRTMQIWVASDVMGLLDYLEKSEVNETRAALVSTLAEAWARADPSTGAKYLHVLEEMAGPVRRGRVVPDFMTAWAKSDAIAAESWIRQDGPPERQQEFLALVLLTKAEQASPGDAVNLILSNPEIKVLQNSLLSHWRNWAVSDPMAAVQKLAELAEDHPLQRNIADIAQSSLIVSADLDTALGHAEQLPDGPGRRRYVQGLVNFGASNDTQFALEALPHLPESRERNEAMGMLTELWMRRDPEALSRWLAELAPSPSRDAAVERFVGLLAETDPVAAAAWAETLEGDDALDRLQGN